MIIIIAIIIIIALGSLRSEVKHEKEKSKNRRLKKWAGKECFDHHECIFIAPDSSLIYPCFMIALPCGLQLISSWLVILQGREGQEPRSMRSGHLFTGIFSSALAQVHCFDSSMALQYWFWRELVSSVFLKIWPVWFLRDLFGFLPHNFILRCHSWDNWHCTISNWRDAVLKAGGNKILSKPWQKAAWGRQLLGEALSERGLEAVSTRSGSSCLNPALLR